MFPTGLKKTQAGRANSPRESDEKAIPKLHAGSKSSLPLALPPRLIRPVFRGPPAAIPTTVICGRRCCRRNRPALRRPWLADTPPRTLPDRLGRSSAEAGFFSQGLPPHLESQAALFQ